MSSLRAYIIGRVLLTIPMLWVLVTVVFLILRVMPGDPCLAILREAATKAPDWKAVGTAWASIGRSLCSTRITWATWFAAISACR